MARLASLSNRATSDDVRHLLPGRRVEQTSRLDSSAKPLARLSRELNELENNLTKAFVFRRPDGNGVEVRWDLFQQSPISD